MSKLRQKSSQNHTLLSIVRWFDDYVALDELEKSQSDHLDVFRIVPFVLLHLACFGVFWVGWSWTAVTIAILLYVVRGLAITGAYHRYFSHRSYKTSRLWQFIIAVIGNSAAQRGPLWWAGHHRHHHKYADTADDIHSPVQRGFLCSHMLWFMNTKNFATRKDLVTDWMKYPELVFIDRFSALVPLALAAVLYVTGEVLRLYIPSAQTTGMQLFIWGFCISTVVLFHATATINSLDHMFGTRRYKTPDQSRNNWILAIITFGEGWHNNHHHYPIGARQGFFWWELDLTYYVLVILSWLGIVYDLTLVPKERRESNLLTQK